MPFYTMLEHSRIFESEGDLEPICPLWILIADCTPSRGISGSSTCFLSNCYISWALPPPCNVARHEDSFPFLDEGIRVQ
jgi:hypothetical protein